jgi:2'-5' RNA ligase
MSETALSGRQKTGKFKIRTFIAIKLPEHVIKTLAELQKDLNKYDCRMKWTRPENIHLTLKFLGDISPDEVDPVCRVVDSSVSGFAPIKLRAVSVGFFPGIRRAKVLWSGISGQTDRLEKLHHAIDNGLHPFGFTRGKRRFTGHLTLGRFKGQADSELLIDMMKANADTISDEFIADAVFVYKSDLKPSGPIYSVLSGSRLVS